MRLSIDRLTEFLRDHLMVDDADLEADVLLFTHGIVDSFSLIEIIQFVEDSEGITVEQEDITLENFDSIQKIIDFLKQKTNEA